MACTGGSGAKVKYGSTFFHWLDDQLLMVEDNVYVGNDFKEDPNIPLPVGFQWGNIGKKNAQDFYYFFVFFLFYNFYE